jgi:hypothetical protein
LALKSEPALRWTNPERETDGGLVFLWLGRGRPEAVSCFYRVRFEGRLVESHEFVSLAVVGLTATLRGQMLRFVLHAKLFSGEIAPRRLE